VILNQPGWVANSIQNEICPQHICTNSLSNVSAFSWITGWNDGGDVVISRPNRDNEDAFTAMILGWG
jgi:hypothetical protein